MCLHKWRLEKVSDPLELELKVAYNVMLGTELSSGSLKKQPALLITETRFGFFTWLLKDRTLN